MTASTFHLRWPLTTRSLFALSEPIGPNGCHSLERIKASRTSFSLDLQVIGWVIEGDNIGCTDEIVFLDTIYAISPPLEGPFEINIQQPDESVLSRTVEVAD